MGQGFKGLVCDDQDVRVRELSQHLGVWPAKLPFVRCLARVDGVLVV